MISINYFWTNQNIICKNHNIVEFRFDKVERYEKELEQREGKRGEKGGKKKGRNCLSHIYMIPVCFANLLMLKRDYTSNLTIIYKEPPIIQLWFITKNYDNICTLSLKL